MDLHSYRMYDVVRQEHGRTVQRAEQRARLKGYPVPTHSGLRLLRHVRTGMWAPCDIQKVPEAKVCWYPTSV